MTTTRHDPYTVDCDDPDHEHVWADEWSRSTFAGTVYRRCTVPYCRWITLDPDDECDCDQCEGSETTYGV